MFWDCSWVQNNIVNGKDYGTYAFELMRASIVPPTLPPDATTLPSTHAPSETTQTPISQTTTTSLKLLCLPEQLVSYDQGLYLQYLIFASF